MGDFAQKSPKGLGPIPAEHEPNILRAVKVDDYYLILWSTGAVNDYGQGLLGYRFVAPDGAVLWQGTDFKPARSRDTVDDDDDVLRQLLGFFTTPDEDAKLTPEQQKFYDSGDAEDIQANYGEGTTWLEPFVDLPGYEHQEQPE